MDHFTETITNSKGREKLRLFLKATPMYAREFAGIAGIDEANLCRILNGGRKSLTVSTAKKIELATDGEITMNDWCLKASEE